MYFDLRITPSAFGCPFQIALGIVRHLLKNPKVETEDYIVADEQTGKNGQKIHRHFHFRIHRHFHFRFIADYKKDSLRTNIVRWFEDREYKITGNSAFALCPYNEPENVERWFRYPMKEKHIAHLTKFTSFTPEQVKNMIVCAQDEFKNVIKYNATKEENKNKKKTLYERMEKELLKKTNLKTSRHIYLEMLKYYVENDHGVNNRTLDNYVNLYMLKNKLISYEDYYDINH